MGAKLKSKTHLLNTFFLFFEPFFVCLASQFSKSANITYIFFFNQKRYRKTQNFTLISNPFKKLLKMHTKKVIGKVWWKGIFPSGFCKPITFFGAFLQNFFNWFKISVYSAFFDTHTAFLNKNIFLLLLALFVNFDCTCAETAKKNGKSFFMNVS